MHFSLKYFPERQTSLSMNESNSFNIALATNRYSLSISMTPNKP